MSAIHLEKNWLLFLGGSRLTGLRARLFAQFGVSSEAFRHVLKGGDFIRVFHKELNGVPTPLLENAFFFCDLYEADARL